LPAQFLLSPCDQLRGENVKMQTLVFDQMDSNAPIKSFVFGEANEKMMILDFLSASSPTSNPHSGSIPYPAIRRQNFPSVPLHPHNGNGGAEPF
jgi:hypothetical protein